MGVLVGVLLLKCAHVTDKLYIATGKKLKSGCVLVFVPVCSLQEEFVSFSTIAVDGKSSQKMKSENVTNPSNEASAPEWWSLVVIQRQPWGGAGQDDRHLGNCYARGAFFVQ